MPVRIIETKNDDVARSSIEKKNNQVVMKERSYSNTKEPDVDATPRKSIWKKQETVVQDRIVMHITIDDDGVRRELIETDTSQNEVVHLETKDFGGEFSHKEYTQREQTERNCYIHAMPDLAANSKSATSQPLLI